MGVGYVVSQARLASLKGKGLFKLYVQTVSHWNAKDSLTVRFFFFTTTMISLLFACSGLGCEFVLESCNNPKTYPYLCDEDILHQCTFDRMSKVRLAA